MDRHTIRALHGSINKWIRIYKGIESDRGEKNCPLCKKFVKGAVVACDGCPVRVSTGISSCLRTPYEVWTEKVYSELSSLTGSSYYDKFLRVIGPLSQEAAADEVLFLISLLPEEEQAKYFI